ncbi:MAG: hypothetical protein QXP34_02350 [Candidatus Aenigmatarchaeota archaeon]
MNRILELLKKGYLVRDVEYISSLSDEDFKLLLEILPKVQEPKVLEKDYIEKILKERKRKSFKISMSFPTLYNEIKIIDYIELLKKRYEKLSEIIKNDIIFFNPISINKISKRFKSFSVIGIVYSVSDEKVVIEDLSSKVELILSEKAKKHLKYLKEDVVIGVKCFFEDSKIVCEDIIFPEFKQKELEKISTQNSQLELKIGFFYEKLSNNFQTDINIYLADENKIDGNNVYLDKKVYIHKFYIENFFFVAIDVSKVNFDLDFFLKTRLVTPKFEEFVKYKEDLALIFQLPNVFILYNSQNKEAMISESNPIVAEITSNIKGCLLDLKERKIYNLVE